MNRARLAAVARELRQRHTLVRLAKTSVVLAAEVALAPWACAAAALLPRGTPAERLLAAQNRLRRLALRWIFPEYRPPKLEG